MQFILLKRCLLRYASELRFNFTFLKHLVAKTTNMEIDPPAGLPHIQIQAAREVNGPELAPIPEGKPLLWQQLEPTSNHVAVESWEEEKGSFLSERTPLLQSTESEISNRGRANSFYNQSFTTSQASLFIPSIQVSLYSSRRDSDSVFSDFDSIKLSETSIKVSTTTNASRQQHTTSLAVSLLEKITEDGKAPAFLALWNILNMIQGTSGVLGTPYAVALGGVASLIAMVVLGLMCDLTGVLLVDCLYQVSPKNGRRKRVRESYSEIAADVWGPCGGKLVDVMTVVYSYSCCTLYIMLLGTTVHDLLGTLTPLTIDQWCLVCACAVLPMVFIRKLSVLAWISMVAVFALTSCVFILLGFSLAHSGSWSASTAKSMLHFEPQQFPVVLGIVVFSFCGHYVFPGVEGSMRKPEKFNKTVHGAFTSNVTLKLVLGCLCFLTFGANTNPIVTLNLSALTHKGIISIITNVFMTVNVYFGYPLQMYVVSGTLDLILLPKLPAACGKGKKYHMAWTLVSRTALVFSTFGVAIAVPQFGLLMSIFGSVLGACLSFIFPCVLHLALKRKDSCWLLIGVEVIVIVTGIVTGILGVVYSSMALKDAYQ